MTRCNAIVIIDNTIYSFYRHCDGYPESAGKDLIEIFTNNFNNWYQDMEYEGFEYETDYPNIHGDVEYIYYINIVDNSPSICYDDLNDNDNNIKLL